MKYRFLLIFELIYFSFKFLRNHPEVFDVDDKRVRLIHQDFPMDVDQNEVDEMDYESSQNEDSLNNGHDNDEHWFCFDDSNVTCVTREQIRKHYGQNDCAYMLFYRQKTRDRSTMDCSGIVRKEKLLFSIIRRHFLDTAYSIPQWLIDEISEKNRILTENR